MSKKITRVVNKEYTPSRFGYYLIAALISFFIGVLSNLIAAWIQNIVIANAFTSKRIVFIISITIIGIIISAIIASGHANESTNTPDNKVKNGILLHRIYLFWSRIITRGKGINIRNLFSISSQINIDSRENDEDNRDL